MSEMDKVRKIQTIGTNVPLRIRAGHFATNHAHTNYYLDMTAMKYRVSEAEDLASALVGMYLHDTVIDTIVCLEGTEVLGAFLAKELAKGGFLNVNAHKTIYVVTPEFNTNSQLIFRDNIVPMIQEKHVMVLMSTVCSGKTANKAMECIQYYGGILTGLSAIFSAEEAVNGMPIQAVFSKKDLPEYTYYDYRDCPYCKAGRKLDALVNPFGISAL